MLLLIIRDGWGINENPRGNAVSIAQPKCYYDLIKKYPRSILQAGGEHVGLPLNQMGNSEVGHMNIGSGRVVYQDLLRINRAFLKNEFDHNESVSKFIKTTKEQNKVHLMLLLSDGGVHSHISHLKSYISLCKKENIKDVYIHAIMDGRDTYSRSGINFIKDIEAHCQNEGVGKIATISGRFYTMDRDSNIDRVQKGYDAMVFGKGNHAESAVSCMEESYQKDVSDEFIVPTVIDNEGLIQEENSVFFLNFRPDRARQITGVLTNQMVEGYKARDLNLNFMSMTRYSSDLTCPVVFSKENLGNGLSEIFSKEGFSQFKIAETEKYAHVSYFFNGGQEQCFEGEELVMIPSPKVETYDLKPEMSAYEVTDRLIQAIHSKKYGYLTVNLANPDMVGHTGNLEAAVTAVKVVDDCVNRLVQAMKSVNGATMITADHGNLDEMIDENGLILTNHSLNPVDFIFVPRPGDRTQYQMKDQGKLADIAPTVLKYMGIPIPVEMDGQVLFKRS
ncbi:MAG: 2,3-bisphosphoglycerate-independent phosphoglycerate mutase [Candidatus Cloacimonetes bacterium]|nr:2,3-bisphosphoglycerate-independent phosphoglycerate mutase [Candidatus Cloacimonadota bacterium]